MPTSTLYVQSRAGLLNTTLSEKECPYIVTPGNVQTGVHMCEQAYLRKVISQQLLNGRCLEDVDTHASNVRHCLSPAVKVSDLCLCMKLSLADKGPYSLTMAAILHQDSACLARNEAIATVTVLQAKLSLQQSVLISLVALR